MILVSCINFSVFRSSSLVSVCLSCNPTAQIAALEAQEKYMPKWVIVIAFTFLFWVRLRRVNSLFRGVLPAVLIVYVALERTYRRFVVTGIRWGRVSTRVVIV